MLTRCPSCATHFRVTPDQLKVRSGRVRCGACQKVFNALDTLIEQQILAVAPPPAESLPESSSAVPLDIELDSDAYSGAHLDQDAVSPAPTFEPPPEVHGTIPAFPEDAPETPVVESAAMSEPAALEAGVEEQPESVIEVEPVERAHEIPPRRVTEFDKAASAYLAAETGPEIERETGPGIAADLPAWNETFPDPPSRRWPWLIGSVIVLIVIALQAVLAFRVELAVLWPEAKPALVALCKIAACEVGLPTKVGLVGIEASDLYPDSERMGRLALTATLKSRAPFAQQFPNIELTLTDTADRAIVRKVLTPADYLPPSTSLTQGMQPNADVVIAVGIDTGAITASGYRLYLFYP